ncbi:MAG: DUF2273 domain-containing protein [Peptostreptococcus sp.]|uniref:DUF2273 domain-containing protein n=1 Tax=Peptostreptococcus sp. TaxID=1262 RepID=UPI002FC5A38A
MDENYHIADVDDIEEEASSIGEIKRKEKPVVKTKIIYENSDTSNNRDYEAPSESASVRFEASDQERFDKGSRSNGKQQSFYDSDASNSSYESNAYSSEDESNNKEKEYACNERIFDEKIISNLYRKRPNTFKGTIVGIILALLILWIGFLKTLMIFVVVLAANIIGQLLDQNPRLLSLFDSIARKFR